MLFTVVSLFWPGVGVGWTGSGDDADALLPKGFEGHRLEYTLSQLVPMAAVLGMASCLYLLGVFGKRPTAARRDMSSPQDGVPGITNEKESIGA
ncbi:Putative amino acid permease [Mycobacteroides abscessus subsp. abscessus]|nr:Putative amino acid permease [Mycobacteroides abscessus subsp. abscessus]